MKKPTQMQAFDALYTLAARSGREEALFGDSIVLGRDVYERTLIGDGYPSAYLEFPLIGEPCFDLLSVHGYIEPNSTFAPGAGFGHEAMFDWYKSVRTPDGMLSCGLELDLSSGETEAAGVYFQQRSRSDLVKPFLESVGEVGRAPSYLETYERLPEGWPAAYVGLFPGRENTPLRIGGYLDGAEHKHCAQDPDYLGRQFRKIGFEAFDKDMLERCVEFLQLAPSIDFQFDIMPDGSLGDTFGLSLSFNETKPQRAHSCMESGYGAAIMNKLQAWGLADDRWKLIADAAFARHVGFERDDGSEGRFALCVLFNYAKIKFTDCEPKPAKFYFLCEADELKDDVIGA